MLSPGFSRWLAGSGFQRRATHVSSRRVVYRLADGSGHVGLAVHEWEALGDYFAAQVKPAGRKAFWLQIGIPPAILIFAFTIGQIVPGAGLLIVLTLFGGGPAIYLWHSYRVKRVARAIETELAKRPRVPPPPARPLRAPRWLQIACFLLVGPQLIIQVYGSLNPDAYRNTPLSGTHVNAFGIAGFTLLGAMLLWHRLARRAQPLDEPEKEAVEESGGRRVDVLARARGSAL